MSLQRCRWLSVLARRHLRVYNGASSAVVRSVVERANPIGLGRGTKMKQLSKLAALAIFLLAGAADAGVLVTLSATGADGQPVSGNVEVGETITVDVFLSVETADDPLLDIRLIAFDFTPTSDTIEVTDFVWMLDLPGGDVLYGFNTVELPTPDTLYSGLGRAEGLILDLTTAPVLVAGFDATVSGSGSLNVVGSTEGGLTTSAEVHAGFDPRVVFSLADATLSGGQLELTVGGGGGGGGSGDTTLDSDGDGVPDSADAFPDDPTETTDSDGDGVGDVADTFPDDPTQGGDGDTGDTGGGGGEVPGPCGAGTAPAMLMMLLTFGVVRTRWRG